eukprot:869006-Rhodomonas_salina.2
MARTPVNSTNISSKPLIAAKPAGIATKPARIEANLNGLRPDSECFARKRRQLAAALRNLSTGHPLASA